MRIRLSKRRATTALAVRPSTAPSAASAKLELRERLKAAWFKICVLGAAAAVAAYRSTQLKGPWQTALAGLSCTFFGGFVAVVSDHPQLIAHPIRWVRRRPIPFISRSIPTGAPQHAKFPIGQFLVWLRRAHDVVIVDTIVFFLADPQYKQQFLDALSEAIRRGARIAITVLCPCSRALATRARQLGMEPRVMKEQAEQALVELDVLKSSLEADRAPGDLDVWLTKILPVQSHYRCDNKILMSILALGSPSQDGPQFEYSVDSPYGRLEAGTLASLRSTGASLSAHMRADLTIRVRGVEVKLPHQRYVMDDETAYLALTDAKDTASAAGFESGAWHHGGERPKQIKRLEFVDDVNDRHLNYTLQRRAEDKYRDGAAYVFYRVVL